MPITLITKEPKNFYFAHGEKEDRLLSATGGCVAARIESHVSVKITMFKNKTIVASHKEDSFYIVKIKVRNNEYICRVPESIVSVVQSDNSGSVPAG